MSFAIAKAHLDKLDLGDRVIVPEHPSATVEEAAEALGCEPAHIAKTMAFLSPEGTAILIVCAGDAHVNSGLFKAAFHTKAKMIAPDQVEALVGHAPGGVCPFGVHEGVQCYLDESLRRFEVVYPACGDAHSGVRLSPAELELAAGARGWVDVCKGWRPEPAEG